MPETPNTPETPNDPDSAREPRRPGGRLHRWWTQHGPGQRASASTGTRSARRPDSADPEAAHPTTATPGTTPVGPTPSSATSATDTPAGLSPAEPSRADRPVPELGEVLAERELALSGIREGVLAVNAQGTITRMNETARQLLGLPLFAAGSRLGRFGLDSGTVTVLSSHGAVDRDRAIVAAGRMLVINQVTIRPRRGSAETVTTLQDRTELVTLRLPGTPVPGPMRLPSPSNQTAEFSHRLHTIEAIIGLGAASDGYIDAICAEDRGVLTAVMDPAVAALLRARTGLAIASGATLTLTAGSALPRLDPTTSTDVTTVLGLLLDNALDSVTGSTDRRLTVTLECIAAGPTAPLAARLVEVRVCVHDTGPGIAGGLINHVFAVAHVAATPARQRADSGGLATVQAIAARRGGGVSYHHDDGASFEARLPVRAAGGAGTAGADRAAGPS